MNKFLYKSGLAALALAAFLSSCKPEIDAPKASAGEANFERYVSLGNSLTAGFADGALYRGGQEVSYPNILAQQFKLVGGGEFRQPLLAEAVEASSPKINGSNIILDHRLKLASVTDCMGTSLSPVVSGSTTYTAQELFVKFAPTNQGPYNNLGVPGAKSFHLIAPNYGDPMGIFANPRTANPFFVRFAASPSVTILEQAMAQNPTFLSLWIGNNDVLGYATQGGDGDEIITPKANFEFAINQIINAMALKNVKGVIANIPDLTKAPFFTTVPYNGLVLKRQGQADSLKAAYRGAVNFKVGQNPFMVVEDGTVRPITSEELILLPASSAIKCQGLGSRTPIPDNLVLSKPEIDAIRNAVADYNEALKRLVDNANAAKPNSLAFVDAYSILNEIAGGISRNQVTYNTALVTGNIFSLDGLHFSPRGNAIVANEFIKAINEKYKSSIPTVNETNYNTVLFP
ncbi:SGNH/GDSL hydrolase family protein [Adhaeribacter soli]|uniref:G-D-S-L family lipolytic protein n=1 Tax=Adhaeribacter soli TaxID=2607655 RepID=A0A5N1J290_9BACT|nr:SGNH/GDSL hydrolase family protein [Adhaeribacter soli]KAA9340167.1 hypothetical protein F0P94_07415 [Adhaeribacter soli]